MKPIPWFRRTRAVLPAMVLILSACGGGSSSLPDAPVPTPSVPPVITLVPGTEIPVGATATAAAATAFVSSVAANADNTSDPLTVGDASLAVTDTEEPDPAV